MSAPCLSPVTKWTARTAYHAVAPEDEVAALLGAPKLALADYDGIMSPLWDTMVRGCRWWWRGAG
jgi:hypothetical protein